MMGSVLRIGCIGMALLSPLLFPYSMTIVLSFAASLFVPWLAVLVGMFSDALYFIPGISVLPTGTIYGIFISLAAVLVHRFAKARIMS